MISDGYYVQLGDLVRRYENDISTLADARESAEEEITGLCKDNQALRVELRQIQTQLAAAAWVVESARVLCNGTSIERHAAVMERLGAALNVYDSFTGAK